MAEPVPLDHPRYAAVGLLCAILGGVVGGALVHSLGDEPDARAKDDLTDARISRAVSRLSSAIDDVSSRVGSLSSRVDSLESDSHDH